VPARRKFLKAPQTELRRSLEVVQAYALARPDVRFRVLHEGRELLDALASSTAGAQAEGSLERVSQIFGAELARQLAAIPEAGEGGEERIHGFLGTPDTARGRRQFIFVNGRLIRDRAVLATFYRAVREEWRSEDFPALFLFLDIPPEEVDVNVHPQKAEVRFRDPALLDRINDALRRGLERARGEEAAPLRPPVSQPYVAFAWQGLGGAPDPDPPVRSTWMETAPPVSPALAERLALPSYAPIDRPIVPLSGRSGEARPFRLLGQYKATLILLEGPDGLYLIDQHVAHERILYERLRRSLSGEGTLVQHLLTPVLLELAPAERLRLLELAPGLDDCGFGLASLSGNTLALTSTPAVLSSGQSEALLRSLANEAGDGLGASADLRRSVLESLAASMACKAAVKMHHPLSAPEMESLVAELFAAEQPYACPHGRPIVLQMTDSDLERRFGRR
jgi:DNA mismatch repair protein MutL